MCYVFGACFHHAKTHPSNFMSIKWAGTVQSTGHTIRIANGFNFVNIKVATGFIELFIQFFQHADHHKWCCSRANTGKSNDITEQHGHIGISFRINCRSWFKKKTKKIIKIKITMKSIDVFFCRQLPSHKLSAISAGKMRYSKLTFFFLSLATAAFPSSIEFFNLSIRRRRPSCAFVCSPTRITSLVASWSGMSEMNRLLHVKPSSPSMNGDPMKSNEFDSGQNTIRPLISKPCWMKRQFEWKKNW